MSENALLNGKRIQIGTCENMYYLRWDQRRCVRAVHGSVNPTLDGEAGLLRFRFPFPDEDKIAPGEFDDCARGAYVRDVPIPDVEHRSVQFSAPGGYLVSLPCPEARELKGSPKVVRNGYPGAFKVTQQKFVHGQLCTICECNGCGVGFRLDTLEEAKPVIDAFRKQSQRGSDWAAVIADRIEAGYTTPPLEGCP